MIDGRKAAFSADRMYRYALRQLLVLPSLFDVIESGHMARGPRALVCMVNPSTASGTENDHTIRKVTGFGQRCGWYSWTVWNLYAYVATDIKDMRSATNPIGPDNDAWLQRLIKSADIIVVAWGRYSKMPADALKRVAAVQLCAAGAGKPLQCWGYNADGSPVHPLTIGYDRSLAPWPQDTGLFG